KGEIITDSETTVVRDALARWTTRVTHHNRLPGESEPSFFNRAVEETKGEIVVFLTPSLLPLGGWLAPLCDLLRSDAGVGVVGGKVFAPDGRLDEAGVVVFSDGSAQGFGCGDFQVEDPLYEYVREVESSSGYLLVTRRVLFEDLGGFDRTFRTAMYA